MDPLGIEDTRDEYKKRFDGFILAQRNKKGQGATNALTRNQAAAWQSQYFAFLEAGIAKDIPDVGVSKAQLRDATLQELGAKNEWMQALSFQSELHCTFTLTTGTGSSGMFGGMFGGAGKKGGLFGRSYWAFIEF